MGGSGACPWPREQQRRVAEPLPFGLRRFVLLRFVYKRNLMRLLTRLSFLLSVPLPKDSSVSQNRVRVGMAGLRGRKSGGVFLLQLPL